MSKWILPLLGFLVYFGAFDAHSQIPRPTYQRPINPPPITPSYPAQSAMPVQSAQPAQTVAQENMPAIAITAESMELLDDKRKLGVGDRLSFRVVQERENAQALEVTEMGEVDFPLVGRVKAANKTLKQLAYDVKQLMDREYYYNSTVLIGLDRSSKFRGRIYLIGNVAGVGPMDIPSDEVFTVSKAILRAGGFGDFADQRKVKLIRKGASETMQQKEDGKKEEIIVDCKAIFKGDANAVDPVVQPDDMIVVPQRLINF